MTLTVIEKPLDTLYPPRHTLDVYSLGEHLLRVAEGAKDEGNLRLHDTAIDNYLDLILKTPDHEDVISYANEDVSMGYVTSALHYAILLGGRVGQVAGEPIGSDEKIGLEQRFGYQVMDSRRHILGLNGQRIAIPAQR